MNSLEQQFNSLTVRSGLSQTVDSARRTASTQLRAGKLNRDTLDILSASVESGQPLQSARTRLKSSAGDQNRFSSTFNQFYLNDKYKDLLSIRTAKDGNTMIGGDVLGQLDLNLREATTNALTMIQRLQEETAGRNTLRESLKSSAFRSSMDHSQLLSRVLAAVQAKECNIQKLNGLRYECMRQSQDYFITGSRFLKIYKQYGIYLSQQEQKDFLDYVSLGARNNCYNMD